MDVETVESADCSVGWSLVRLTGQFLINAALSTVSTVSTNNVGQINSNQLIGVSSSSSIMGDEFKSN